MAYVDPASVDSPKGSVRNLRVIFNAGEGEWAVAEIDWKGKARVGIRWNGREGEQGVGNPQSRGHPTWFIVPDLLEDAVREAAERLRKSKNSRLAEGYRAMARDREREREARDWMEGLIADAGDSKG
jgi:hypothetical protein